MSDYIYMLESHLNPDQYRVVEEVQAAAGAASMNVFLTGGAMRDMLGGFRIRDLDFVVEGNALRIAKTICERTGARTVSLDEHRKSAELVFPSGVTAQVAMSRLEKYSRTSGKPAISQATIQEDLRGRDFTCNAIALSLNRASRGLLLDPMNGLADMERRELRAVTTYGFYDDPSRLLRLVRLRVRMGYTVEERTQMQIANAREAQVEQQIPPRTLAEELRRISAEDNPAEILKGLEEMGLLALFSPALASKMNTQGLAKFDKICRIVPDDPRWRAARFGTFLHVLTERLTPKDRQGLIKGVELSKAEIGEWQKLDAQSKKLESALKSARLRKASQVYQVVAGAPPEQILFVLYHSGAKLAQDRLRNHFGKYLPQIAEITSEEWAAIPGEPGTAKYLKAREEFIWKRLDRRVKKIVEPPPAPEPEVVVARRGGQVAARR